MKFYEEHFVDYVSNVNNSTFIFALSRNRYTATNRIHCVIICVFYEIIHTNTQNDSDQYQTYQNHSYKNVFVPATFFCTHQYLVSNRRQ